MRPFSSENSGINSVRGLSPGKKWRVFLVATLSVLMLGTVSAVSESFEDGDLSEYGGDTSYFSTTQTRAFEGSYSLEGGNNANGPRHYIADTDRSIKGQCHTFRAYVDGTDATTKSFLYGTKSETSSPETYGADIDALGDITRIIYSDGSGSGSTITSASSVGIPANEWLKGKVCWKNNDHRFELYDSNGNLLSNLTATDSTISSGGIGWMDDDNQVDNIWFDDLRPVNTPPSFDSVSTSPSSWTLGSSINVSADVSDSDGTVQSVTADVWENGTKIVDNKPISFTTKQDGGAEFTATDLFTVDESDVYYNYTLTATDDDGATSQYEDSQFIKDEPPEFNFSGIENKTYFSYDRSYTVDLLNDGDNVPDEQISCTTFFDGNQSNTFSGVEGIYTGSYSGLDTDLGQHSFKVSCTDPAGNTKNKSVDYSVKAFEHTGLSADSNTFETVEEQFTFDSKVGEMVEDVDYNLVYGGENVESKLVDYSNDSVLTDQNSVMHNISLVSSDNVDKKYNISADISYKSIDGSDASLNKDSSSNTQTVDQAYKFGSHNLEDGFTQLEASNLDYNAVLDLKTPDAQGTVTGSTTFNSTNNSLVKDGLDYSTEFSSDLINSSSEVFPVNTEYRVEFEGETRTFNDSKDLTLDRIEFSKDSNSGAESIRFKSKDEINDSSQPSNLEIGLQVSNPDRPDVQRFYGFESSSSTSHSLYLSPSYGDVKVNAFDKERIQYGKSEDNYPDRRYFLLDEVVDNQTSIVELYMLKESKGLNVNLELLDDNRQQLSQHLIRVEKNIPSQETTRTVAMARTGSGGTAKAFLDSDQQYIFSVFDSEGEYVGQIGPQSINVPETTLELTEEDTANFENVINEVRFTDVTLQDDLLTVDYVSDTERLNNLSLTVYRDGVFNNNKVVSDSSTDLQGRLTVSGFNASEKRYFYELEGTFGEKDFVLSTEAFGQETSDYGNTGLFMSMLIITSLGIAGALVSFSTAIALTTLGVMVSSPLMLGFLPIGQSGLIAIVALASIMVWRGTR